jgi:N4-gp56 family major capsid protein
MLTDFGALTPAQKKVWSERTWIQGRDQSFWFANGMVGSGTEDSTKPINLVTELTATDRGDRCIMQLIAELQEDGTVGDNQVEGNEESLVNDDQEIVIDQLRHGVKSKGKMSEQRTVIRFRAQARNKLAFWLGDKIDELTFLTISGRAYTLKLDGSSRSASSQLPQLAFASSVVAASSGRIFYAGSASSEGSLTTSDKMTWNLLVSVSAAARRKRLKPVRIGGREYYCVVMSPEQARDLKQDSNYQTNVSRAMPRGASNPLFTGAFAVIDNLMLYEHPKVYNTFGLTSGVDKWGSGNTVDGAQAMLYGAQALGFARIGDPAFEESDNQDYKNRQGLAYGRIIGLLKPQFRSIYDSNTAQDFGCIAIKTAAAPSIT